MAADWIKVETVLPDKPEVSQIAGVLGIDHDSVVGKLVRLWVWADAQTIDGNAVGVTKSFIDRCTYCPGFADAMEQAGWLQVEGMRVRFPNFDRHNGKTAKSRGQTYKRVANHRNAKSVTRALPETETETETEVKKKKRARTAKFSPPTLPDVADYCRERGNSIDPEQFIAHYESNGWRVGRNPMKDWKATVRTWERNGINRPGGTGRGNSKLDKLQQFAEGDDA